MLFIRVFRVALYPRPEGRGFTASLIKIIVQFLLKNFLILV
jgi:hypothetical protein